MDNDNTIENELDDISEIEVPPISEKVLEAIRKRKAQLSENQIPIDKSQKRFPIIIILTDNSSIA